MSILTLVKKSTLVLIVFLNKEFLTPSNLPYTGFQFQSIAIANIHEDDVCVFLNHQVIHYQTSRVILELY
ncbi:hypothetical protein L1987_06066 [Smallanthus sonchifolius]|uniref:Uncharacterized protein n=1 Tax=Smallanthus sonchifolius TaxID=185202 RepID=A0ACB9JX78_9ASTR|nr:hypothetical protein L1987_06066 [Smallanthus sonchifolius]